MAIKVALVPNTIQQDGSMVPRLVHRSSVSFDEVLDYMDYGTGLSRDDLTNAIGRLAETLVFYMAKGFRVETPLGDF
jgi:hypothetical protein